jgi:hypothetical protein
MPGCSEGAVQRAVRRTPTWWLPSGAPMGPSRCPDTGGRCHEGGGTEKCMPCMGIGVQGEERGLAPLAGRAALVQEAGARRLPGVKTHGCCRSRRRWRRCGLRAGNCPLRSRPSCACRSMMCGWSRVGFAATCQAFAPRRQDGWSLLGATSSRSHARCGMMPRHWMCSGCSAGVLKGLSHTIWWCYHALIRHSGWHGAGNNWPLRRRGL